MKKYILCLVISVFLCSTSMADPIDPFKLPKVECWIEINALYGDKVCLTKFDIQTMNKEELQGVVTFITLIVVANWTEKNDEVMTVIFKKLVPKRFRGD